MLNYPLQIGKLQRQLPLIDLNSELKIASFVILGDAELTHEAAVSYTHLRSPRD